MRSDEYTLMYTMVIMVMTTRKMIIVCRYDAMKVALSPPAEVYKITPQGMKNAASLYCIPVRAWTVAAPPRRSMDVTMMFAVNPKKRKVRWAVFPQRARAISHMVWADGATSLRLMARTPKSRTWMVAPEAYLRRKEKEEFSDSDFYATR